MTLDTDKEESLSSLLQDEKLWKLEDKLNTVVASNSEHERELARHKRALTLMNERFDSLDPHKTTKLEEAAEHGN